MSLKKSRMAEDAKTEVNRLTVVVSIAIADASAFSFDFREWCWRLLLAATDKLREYLAGAPDCRKVDGMRNGRFLDINLDDLGAGGARGAGESCRRINGCGSAHNQKHIATYCGFLGLEPGVLRQLLAEPDHARARHCAACAMRH